MCIRQEILLSGHETVQLMNSLRRPSAELISRRDRFLAPAKDYIVTQFSETSFAVDIPELDLSFLDQEENCADEVFKVEYNHIQKMEFSYSEILRGAWKCSQGKHFSNCVFNVAEDSDRISFCYEHSEMMYDCDDVWSQVA